MSNVKGRIYYEDDDIRSTLKNHVTSRILWNELCNNIDTNAIVQTSGSQHLVHSALDQQKRLFVNLGHIFGGYDTDSFSNGFP